MQQYGQNNRGLLRLNLPAIVVALLCLWSLDTASFVLALSGKPAFQIFLLPRWLILLCGGLDGVLWGIVIAAVCPQRVLIHIGCSFLLFHGVGILFGLLVTALTWNPSFILPSFLKLAGALGAALLVEQKLARSYRHVVFEGIGDAWEPRRQKGLAVFFGVCLAIAVLPNTVEMLWWAKGAGSGLQMVREGMAAPKQDAADVDPVAAGLMVGSALNVWFSLFGFLTKGSAFLGLAQRCFPRSAGTLLSHPGRNVVWLRPFDVDGMPQGLMTTMQVAFSPWQRVLGRTLEQKIDRCFRGFADLVAFGMPGEKLPQSGAARLYVDHACWQPIVGALIQNSAGVILHAAVSAGTLWEWSQATARLPRTRLLLCMPVRGPSWRARKKKYQALRAQIEQTTGLLLPEEAAKDAAFAFFESHDSRRAVWLTRRCSIPSPHPLAPALMRMQRLKFSLHSQSMIALVILLTIFAALLVLLGFGIWRTNH